MGISPLDHQVLHITDPAESIHLLTPLPQTMHSRIDADVDCNPLPIFLQFPCIGVIHHCLAQVILFQQGELQGMGIAQDQDLSFHAALPQFHTFLHTGHTESPDTHFVQFPAYQDSPVPVGIGL